MPEEDESQPHTQLTPELQSFLHGLSPHLWTSAMESADRCVVDVITVAAFTEELIVELISEHFAPDREKAEYLADNVMRKLSNDRKLEILAHIIAQSQRAKEFADVVPKLREFFNLRNFLAHSYSTNTVTVEGGDIIFEQVRRRQGKSQRTTLSLASINQTLKLVHDAQGKLKSIRSLCP